MDVEVIPSRSALDGTPGDRSSTASSSGDDESHVVDNILGDIRSGFIQKKSFGDTAFTVTKVRKVSYFHLVSSGNTVLADIPFSRIISHLFNFQL